MDDILSRFLNNDPVYPVVNLDCFVLRPTAELSEIEEPSKDLYYITELLSQDIERSRIDLDCSIAASPLRGCEIETPVQHFKSILKSAGFQKLSGISEDLDISECQMFLKSTSKNA